MRIKATVAYDGGYFYGFQHQPNKPTVTGALTRAFRQLGIESDIVGSGRTDRGVHATGQVIHTDIPSYWHDLNKLQTHLNRKLHGVRIVRMEAVDMRFHARYSAQKRLYRYRIALRPPSLFEERYSAYFGSFDKTALQRALALFCGTHDFALFCKQGSNPPTTRRRIFQTRYYTYAHYGIITVLGDAFLRAQVRLMVQAALAHAQGRLPLEALYEQLEAKKAYIRLPAPPQALYLSRVYYDTI